MVLPTGAVRSRVDNRPLSEPLNARAISHRDSSISEAPRGTSPPSGSQANFRLNGKIRAPKLGGGLVAAARSLSESPEEGYHDDFARRLYDHFADDELDDYMTKWHDIHQERLESLLLERQNAPDDSIEQKIEAEQSILHAIRTFLGEIDDNRDVAGDGGTTSGESTSRETMESSDRDADGSYNESHMADDETTNGGSMRHVIEETELNSDEIDGLRELDNAEGESSDEEMGNDAEMDHDMTDAYHVGDYAETPTPANTLMFDENAANHEVVQSIENSNRDDERQQSEDSEPDESDLSATCQSTTPTTASTYATGLKVEYKTNFPDREDLFASSVMSRVDEIQELDWKLEQFRAPPIDTQEFASITFRESAMAAYDERELRRQDLFRIIENGEAFEQESMLPPEYNHSQLFDRFQYYCAVDFADKENAMLYGYEVPAASHALQALPIPAKNHKTFWESGKTMLLDRDQYIDEMYRSDSLSLSELARVQSRLHHLQSETKQFCELARAKHSILALSEAHTYRNLYEWGSGKVPELTVAQRCLDEIERDAAACRHTSQEKTMQLLFEYQEHRQQAHQLAMREGHYALTGGIPGLRPYEPAPLSFDQKQMAKEIKVEP